MQVECVRAKEEAEHPSMPRSAIATVMVDDILHLAKLPEALVTYWRNAANIQLPEVGLRLLTRRHLRIPP